MQQQQRATSRKPFCSATPVLLHASRAAASDDVNGARGEGKKDLPTADGWMDDGWTDGNKRMMNDDYDAFTWSSEGKDADTNNHPSNQPTNRFPSSLSRSPLSGHEPHQPNNDTP